jgi:hypothetical protein
MAKKYLPRNINEVITWSRNQVKDPTQDWTGLCQSHCRQAYGVPAWAGSAIIAWRKIPAAQKTVGGKPSDAPRGALLYYDIGQFGRMYQTRNGDRARALLRDLPVSLVDHGKVDQGVHLFLIFLHGVPATNLKNVSLRYYTRDRCLKTPAKAHNLNSA